MKYKHVKLEEDTRIFLNIAKSQYLIKNPETKKLTDNLVIKHALKNIVRGKNARTNKDIREKRPKPNK